MDPQVAWDQLLCAYADGDWDEIENGATELLSSLDRGGSPPKVVNHLGVDPDFHRALAVAGCLFALDSVQGEWTTKE